MTRQFQLLADQAFSRTAGAPLVGGTSVRLLKDGCENYPMWLDAIRTAAVRVQADRFISRLPGGYAAPVRERGAGRGAHSTVSAGSHRQPHVWRWAGPRRHGT